MRENLYVIYDTNAGLALKPPMIDRNDVQPIRILTESANNSDSAIAKYPAEFQLIQIATIDLETLQVEPLDKPRLVAIAIDLLPKKAE